MAAVDRTELERISIRYGIPLGSVSNLYYGLKSFYQFAMPGFKEQEYAALAITDFRAIVNRLEKAHVYSRKG